MRRSAALVAGSALFLMAMAAMLLSGGGHGHAAAQLLTNGDFASDVASWTPTTSGGTYTQAWNGSIGGPAGSDEVHITAGTATVLVSQCVPATAGKSYTAIGDVLLP